MVNIAGQTNCLSLCSDQLERATREIRFAVPGFLSLFLLGVSTQLLITSHLYLYQESAKQLKIVLGSESVLIVLNPIENGLIIP